jgi:hypothetical protein
VIRSIPERLRSFAGVLALTLLTCSSGFAAEVPDARCVVYPDGSDEAGARIACSIQQEQGLVLIRREDGVVHDLRPAGDKPGLYMDQNGGSAYGRPLPEGNGFLFRFTGESVEISW